LNGFIGVAWSCVEAVDNESGTRDRVADGNPNLRAFGHSDERPRNLWGTAGLCKYLHAQTGPVTLFWVPGAFPRLQFNCQYAIF